MPNPIHGHYGGGARNDAYGDEWGESPQYIRDRITALIGQDWLRRSSSTDGFEVLARDTNTRGGEHAITLSENAVFKFTLPQDRGFGVRPKVTRFERHHRSTGETELIEQIEFFPAGLGFYLRRMQLCNELLGDKWLPLFFVDFPAEFPTLVSVQPLYREKVVSQKVLERGFKAMGWTVLKKLSHDSSFHHVMFYDPIAEVGAVDLKPKNCYLNGNKLQPFDIILFDRDDELLEFFGYFG